MKTYEKKTLIIIGGGILQVPLIETAKEMGLFTIVMDMDPQAPGMLIADHPVVMSTRDVEGCVREAVKLSKLRKIDGVITAGTDATKSVSAIANALKLPGIRYSVAEAATNKVLMRKALKQHQVLVPNFEPIWNLQDLYKAIDKIGFPAVLKPTENMGARGVIKISKREEIPVAYHHSKAFSPTGELILEEYLDGSELSIDALIWKDQIMITGIADRVITGEPYFIEIGHNMPSSLPKSIIDEAKETMKRAIRAIGIDIGAAKGDLKVTERGIYVGEIAARLSGGFMSSHTYPISSGVKLYRRAIQIAMGEEPEPIEENFEFVCIERSLLSSQGKLISIDGVEEAKRIDGICDIIITKKIGTILQKPTSNIDKIGHIIAKAKTLEQAINIAEKARSYIQIQIDELEGIDWTQVENNARKRFPNDVCWVCKVCDGTNCASGVPGMGGVGNQFSFIDNIRSLQEYKILPRYIHRDVEPDLSFEFLGRKFDVPIMIAPMTGASTNLKNAISEEEIVENFLKITRTENTITWVGDGITPERYKTIFQVIERFFGNAIAILKPRDNDDEIIKRIRYAEEIGLLAVGIDIDAFLFKTFLLRKEKGRSRNVEELKYIRKQTKLPFILKGILTLDDAYKAIEIGADAIVVSNHGGRILDNIPGVARILPEIAKEVKGKIKILADGGIRSGSDVFKMLCLGADGVLVGRPFLIAIVGGGDIAGRHLLRQYKNELYYLMKLYGIENIKELDSNLLYKVENSLRTQKRKDYIL
ncbi:MAG: alpha-hydroxy-acid oxidizing protein [Leptospiraceae bacterium]|nr:alpha-hydroxy-acid oxidizing protein [Leptospiraceae bacterium]MDW7976214.1 alpha-hydroxy-acid oxidizing protein [Leptospiraceae bacterium]